MKIETTYPPHVTAYRDFLLSQIEQVEQAAQIELEQSRDYSQRAVEAKRREVIELTRPYHNELVRLLSRTTCNYILSRDST